DPRRRRRAELHGDLSERPRMRAALSAGDRGVDLAVAAPRAVPPTCEGSAHPTAPTAPSDPTGVSHFGWQTDPTDEGDRFFHEPRRPAPAAPQYARDLQRRDVGARSPAR